MSMHMSPDNCNSWEITVTSGTEDRRSTGNAKIHVCGISLPNAKRPLNCLFLSCASTLPFPHPSSQHANSSSSFTAFSVFFIGEQNDNQKKIELKTMTRWKDRQLTDCFPSSLLDTYFSSDGIGRIDHHCRFCRFVDHQVSVVVLQ